MAADGCGHAVHTEEVGAQHINTRKVSSGVIQGSQQVRLKVLGRDWECSHGAGKVCAAAVEMVYTEGTVPLSSCIKCSSQGMASRYDTWVLPRVRAWVWPSWSLR
jgi:hypothetical protein